jgi:hypothetical protein
MIEEAKSLLLFSFCRGLSRLAVLENVQARWMEHAE